MKAIFLIAILAFSMNAFAQPVILNGNNIPLPGLSYPLNYATTSSAGNGGSNQVWDFSSLSFTQIGTVEVITPSSSPIGASFPTANYALSVVGQNAYSFFNIASDKMEVQAWSISSPGTGNDYSPNPRTVLKFPFNYLDTENDTWQEVGEPASNVTLTYDGYGTLITPTITYDNVVRVKEDYGGGENDYEWYILNPLMVVAIFSHGDNSLYHFGATEVTGVQNLPDAQLTLNIYPNPAGSVVTVSNLSKGSTLSVTDLTGKVVYNAAVTDPQMTINTSDFVNGVYFMEVADQGDVVTKKLIIDR